MEINGLNYIEDYISNGEHEILLNYIDGELWSNDLKRRVQHYGYKYDYRSRQVNHKNFIGKLPNWSNIIIDRFLSDGLLKHRPDQIIVNEYLPGQGISNHIDCEPCFDDTIISVSLGSTCVMEMTSRYNKTKKIGILLKPKSLLLLSSDARYKWMHGIPARKSDDKLGVRYIRNRRVSLTFRKVIQSKI